MRGKRQRPAKIYSEVLLRRRYLLQGTQAASTCALSDRKRERDRERETERERV